MLNINSVMPYTVAYSLSPSSVAECMLCTSMSSPEDAYYNCKDCESKFKSIKELDEHTRKIHKPNLE